jgi:hypothetical protein
MRGGLIAAWVALALTQGHVDLSEILAPPLEADYSDAGGVNFLTGSFDAHRYAVWLAPNSSGVKGIEDILTDEGFRRGYARAWWQPIHGPTDVGSSRQQWLTETVEEFGSGTGARRRFEGTRQFTTSETTLEHWFEPGIANSYGAVLDAGYSAEYSVAFMKGNDVYFVQMFSGVNDMTERVIAQAKRQFDVAPAFTISPNQWSPSGGDGSDPYAGAKTKVLGTGTVLALIAIGRLLVWIFGSSRRRSA